MKCIFSEGLVKKKQFIYHIINSSSYNNIQQHNNIQQQHNNIQQQKQNIQQQMYHSNIEQNIYKYLSTTYNNNIIQQQKQQDIM